MDEYIGTVEYFTSSTLCGIELNRHIGYEASVLYSKPSDNFGEVTFTWSISVDQLDPGSAGKERRLLAEGKAAVYRR